jgi:putative membrane protein
MSIAASAVLIFANGAVAKDRHKGSANRLTGAPFASTAAQSNIAEMRMADLAQTKTTSPQVKNLAQHLATDHAKANEQLKEVAAKMNLTLPDKMNAEDQAEYNRLSNMSGSEFDKAYTRAQVKDHKAVIARYRHEADNGTDPELKQYAANTLPLLERHLQMSKNAESAVHKGQ